MCTGVELALIGASTAGAVSAVSSAKEQKKAARNAEAQAANAENERKTAETKATQSAYAQTQMSRRALRDNSLFTGGGDAGGRTTLGV